MSETQKTLRLSKIAKEFNLSLGTIVDFLASKGHKVEQNPNAKIGDEEYTLLMKEFQSDKFAKEEAQQVAQIIKEKKESVTISDAKTAQRKKEELEDQAAKDIAPSATEKVLESLMKKERERIAEKTPEKKPETIPAEEEKPEVKSKADSGINVKVINKIDLDSLNTKTRPDKKGSSATKEDGAAKNSKDNKKTEVKAEETEVEKQVPELKKEPEPKIKEAPQEDFLATKIEKLEGVKILGKVVLPVEKKPVASSDLDKSGEKKKRKRIKKGSVSEQEINNLGKQQATIAKDRKQTDRGSFNKGKREAKPALTDEEIQQQIKETLARLSNQGGKSKASKYRREK